MAVYSNHRHQPYQGELTGTWQRFLVIPRYALRSIIDWRFFLLFFSGCFALPIFALLFIYLQHNLDALRLLGIDPGELDLVGNSFFRQVTQVQCILSFLLSALVAPGLLLPDINNNGLPLYFSRPVSRRGYLAGKLLVLAAVQSAVTWAPLTLLFLFQAGLEGDGWILAHFDILVAIVGGSLAWILVTSLIALAVSSLVRWKAAGGALLLGVVFIAAGMGEAINQIFSTRWGSLFNLIYIFDKIWEWMFSYNSAQNIIVVPAGPIPHLPSYAYVLDPVIIVLICLFVLWRKIRAFEVVK